MRLIFPSLLLLLLVGCGGSDADADEATPDPETGGSEEATTEDGADGPTEDPESPLLAVGTVAPDFAAPDQTGVERRLSAERGKIVVLYFYPRDETPGCTAEACAFRDVWERYDEADITVFGVSVDSVESHLAFAERHGLPFSLIADTDAAIATAYGVRTEQGGTVFARRVTYLIDAEGNIGRVFADVDPGVHASEVLEAAAGL